MRIDRAILIGSLSSHSAGALAAAWPADRFMHVEELAETPIDRIAGLLNPGDSVLIKASRGIALERIVDALRATTIELVA